MFGKELPDAGALRIPVFQMIETGAEVPRARQCCEIPTHVLAGDTNSHHLAIEFVQRMNMFQQGAFDLAQRRRREQLAGAAREKEAFGERERTYLADQGRRAERTALARELHDIAGHHLSGIIVSAQAAGALIDSDPVRSRSLLRELEQEARATMVDLRGTVGLLRPDTDDQDGAGRTPVGSPGVGDLPELVESARRRGRSVSYTEAGEPFRLGPLAEASVYRMVQESLANSARHAPGTGCSVSIGYSPDEMVVLVDNDAPGPGTDFRPTAAGRPGDGRGYGLIGMDERAELIGANLTTGPSENGGWCNVLRIPRPGGGARR